MTTLTSDVLGFRASQYGDVTALAKLRDYFSDNENYFEADRIDIQVKAYAEGWENVSTALGGEFPPVTYDYDNNVWRDATSGQFAKNPAFNDAFVTRARELNLIFEE